MATRVENIDGTEYLIVERVDDNGPVIHLIDMRAISSWGVLLGISDHAQVIQKIVRFKDKQVSPGEPNHWTPLYETLAVGLDQMSQAGVPPEYMEELLTLDAPIPTQEATDAIIAAQVEGVSIIDEDPDIMGPELPAVVAAVLGAHSEKINQGRLKFVDALAPVYEIPPPPATRSVPEAMDVINGIAPVNAEIRRAHG